MVAPVKNYTETLFVLHTYALWTRNRKFAVLASRDWRQYRRWELGRIHCGYIHPQGQHCYCGGNKVEKSLFNLKCRNNNWLINQSCRAEEIQDRLIKNKSLLNVVEPTLDNNCLDILLGILQRRIQCDKESLFQFTQLRKEAGDVTADAIVAPLLMRYSRGCKQVLVLWLWFSLLLQFYCFFSIMHNNIRGALPTWFTQHPNLLLSSNNSAFIHQRQRKFSFLNALTLAAMNILITLCHFSTALRISYLHNIRLKLWWLGIFSSPPAVSRWRLLKYLHRKSPNLCFRLSPQQHHQVGPLCILAFSGYMEKFRFLCHQNFRELLAVKFMRIPTELPAVFSFYWSFCLDPSRASLDQSGAMSFLNFLFKEWVIFLLRKGL